MSDKRIDPSSIPDLFKRLGMKPMQGTFGNGKDCGCLTTAIAIEGGMPRTDYTYCVEARDWCNAEFGREYTNGLIMGWDRGEKVDRDDQDGGRILDGIDDSAEAARLVFGEVAT